MYLSYSDVICRYLRKCKEISVVVLQRIVRILSLYNKDFLSKGRFLTEEVSLLRTFALALLKGDLPPTN